MSPSEERDLASASDGTATEAGTTAEHIGSTARGTPAVDANGPARQRVPDALADVVESLVRDLCAAGHMLESSVRDVDDPTGGHLLAAVNELERITRDLRDAAVEQHAPTGAARPPTGAEPGATPLFEIGVLVDALERTASRLNELAGMATKGTAVLDLLEAADRTYLAAHTLSRTRPVIDAASEADARALRFGESDLPDARHLGERSERADRRADQDAAAGPRVRRERPTRRSSYVRLVGTRNGAPFQVDIVCDGTILGDGTFRIAPEPPNRDATAPLTTARDEDEWRPISAPAWPPGTPRADRRALRPTGDRGRPALEQIVARHDRVISELYAVGLTAQSLLSRSSDLEQRERLTDIIDWLDAAIVELRTTTFEIAMNCRDSGHSLGHPSWSADRPRRWPEPQSPPEDTGISPAS